MVCSAAVAYHPAMLSVPADVETVDVPSAILIGDKDNSTSSAGMPLY